MGVEPPHEAQAMKIPAAGSSRSFLMERLPRWRGVGWVLMEWIMILLWLGGGVVMVADCLMFLLKMEKPGGMIAGLFAGGTDLVMDLVRDMTEAVFVIVL